MQRLPFGQDSIFNILLVGNNNFGNTVYTLFQGKDFLSVIENKSIVNVQYMTGNCFQLKGAYVDHHFKLIIKPP